MKNIIYTIGFMLAFTACDNEFLDRTPLDQISSSNVYQDEALAQAYIDNTMGRLPFGIHGSTGYGQYPCMIASITDEARAKSGWVQNNSIIIKGAITPTQSGGLDLWNSAYVTIRQANEIIEGMEASSLTEAFKAAAIAQARYIRAFTYFDLARRYGDVPLITQAQTLEDDLFVSQTARQDIYAYVVSELKEIATVLPELSQAGSANVSKQAAIALASRTALYAENWTEAATLADRLITGTDNDGLDLFDDYRGLFLSTGGNIETIFEKQTLPPLAGQSFGLYNFPVRWRSDWGGQTDPTQELVDDYEMKNGLPITDPASGYDPSNPYANRDPRFDASIFYHGSEFSEIQPSKGEPFIDMEWNNGNEGPGDPGKFHGAASITGYLVKKFANPADGFSPQNGKSISSWQELRFAEVLLIYAEAANEAEGPTNKVYNAINRIRDRAGISDLPTGLSKDQMRERIRHERKIELVFENHRYWDLLRWGIAKDVLDGFVPHGIRIERTADAPSKEVQPQLFDPQYLDYTVFEVQGRTQTFPDSHNKLPIPQSEINKNPNLKQNSGY
ncbi:RagB/SusD family nutrient uptake outer membrane protein [Aestuariibaculum sediminum]|uniref:RagB/SusD family nutrient uptake outer membrane protein n=1 Tax=Aestuariibaculum sediminum TaxID=2770637 RepID=A0A8J6U7X6_9FLAO|nr:RagB/SusD family nutrient uptake outer membrane protein [Aestuariibaculum sediminum]MBD0832588.1 RagB/SusD family nutrient uptake outer membrane protein [Aestuariibaculum sediminum]